MGKFRQILTELSARDTPIFFLFLDDNLSKCQRILTKLDTCIDIKEIWFWIANGQISSIFDRVICPRPDNGRVLLFYFFILPLPSADTRRTVVSFWQKNAHSTG